MNSEIDKSSASLKIKRLERIQGVGACLARNSAHVRTRTESYHGNMYSKGDCHDQGESSSVIKDDRRYECHREMFALANSTAGMLCARITTNQLNPGFPNQCFVQTAVMGG